MDAKLPNSDKAVIESGKLKDYLLSLSHPIGMGKAKFFMQFGFTPENLHDLEEALRDHGLTRTVLKQEPSKYGVKYTLQCSIRTPDERNPCILSVWIVEFGKKAPRLITAYPDEAEI